ncbi:hypothetical protein [Rhodopirellula europaea]|uniref:hypothetical protein n=1 Tax=Rhodopirellula europaea TaxID=1263866 RepID=UPI003D270924|tara:strand:+ start:3245 stop:3664 length:420 start_codon:yes stop_codon:yes gene_type:complete
MAQAARAFDDTNRQNVHSIAPQATRVDEGDQPWLKVRNGEMPPMMFQLRMRDGQITSFAFSDIRQVHSRDAGHIRLSLLAMGRMVVTIQGRHLRDLASLIGIGMVRWIEESDLRDVDRPETHPEIVSISIESTDSGNAG